MKTIHLLHYLITVLLLASCKQVSHTPSAQLVTESKDTTAVKTPQLPQQFVENDSLVRYWERELEKMVRSSPKFRLQKKPYTNIHDTTITDTIKTYAFKNSTVVFYKARTFEAILTADIKDNALKIARNVGPGMKKKPFQNHIGTPITANIVKVGNVEQTLVFTFTFSKDILQSIHFEGYID